MLLGAFQIPGLETENLSRFSSLTDYVLGYIAFSVGAHLDFRQLRNSAKRLLLLTLAEALITPTVVILAMTYVGGFPIWVSFVFAAIAVAGAPGTTILVVREARARGVFVRTLVPAVALIDMVAVCLFVIVDTELTAGAPSSSPMFIITSLPYALKALAIGAGIGIAAAAFVIVVTRKIVGQKLLGGCLIASILFAWGIADALGVSSILACTFVGMALGNLISEKERAGEAYINKVGDVLFIAFYCLAGLRLDFGHIVPVAGLIALFFFARVIGKVLSTFISMSAAGSIKSVRKYLGIALIPHGGVAVGIMLFAQNDPALAEYADTILAVGLSALALNQLLGPSATRFALHAAGEVNRDRPRLLDFLHEEHIITDFRAASKEDAMRQLVDVLYRTHRISLDKSAFLESVITRDAEDSCCIGEGLMIPHGVLNDETDSVVGVMALTSKGLAFETPDGEPIHAIVLLATPDAHRMRHLEVLAAFAKAIGGDRDVRDQLYHARSPAHADQILHQEDAENFNYFFVEAMTPGDTLSMPAQSQPEGTSPEDT